MTRLQRLAKWLDEKLEGVRASREPFSIGRTGDTYMRRWFLVPRNRWFNVYHHELLRDDDDRALHDHPWWSISLCLSGWMTEVLDDEGNHCYRVGPGVVRFRRAALAHRLELNSDHCRTLFITGPRIREWGFHCPQGWRHWKEFTGYAQTGDSSIVGPGCD